jgi:hypothetical protein
MPEMLHCCGQEFRVRARAHKVCDTIDWQQFRRMANAVHLAELRCDGSAHGDCQAGCLPYWKDAWLRPVESSGEGGSDLPSSARTSDASSHRPLVTVETLSNATQAGTNEAGQPLFSCQATEVLRATEGPVNWWEPQAILRGSNFGQFHGHARFARPVGGPVQSIPEAVRAIVAALLPHSRGQALPLHQRSRTDWADSRRRTRVATRGDRGDQEQGRNLRHPRQR